jgi:cell division protein FtsW (lipid II flippase)
LPLVLIGFAGLFLGKSTSEKDEWRRPLAYLGLLALTLAAVPWLVRDNGLVIYALPIAIVALLVSARSRAAFRVLWNMPTLVVVAAALFAFGWQWIDNRSWSDDAAAAVAAARYAETPEDRAEANHRAAALVQATTADNANWLRIWTAIAPGRISDAGSSEAESQKRVAATLREYASSFWGRGYMVVSQPGDVRRYQTDDNLSAVHVMSPFGRLGAAILVLALAALAWRASAPLRSASSEVPSLAQMAGVLAGWTLLCTATYMILANLQWLPFTGRNVYLLAASSVSDLIEGTVLLLMTASALAWRQVSAN